MYESHILRAEIPDGWHVLRRPITSVLSPKQRLAAASHPVALSAARPRSCHPKAALRQLPSNGALVQIIEYRLRFLRTGEFPPRPERLRYADGTFAPFECAGPSFRFVFSDRGRALQAHVWFGEDRGNRRVRREALELLNGVEVSAAASTRGSSADRGARTPLASGTLADGRTVVLSAKGTPPYEGVSPCLILSGIDRDDRQCGTAPSALLPPKSEAAILSDAYAQRRRSAPLEVYGTVLPQVSDVVVADRGSGVRQRRPALVLRATDKEALRRAGISSPFGYFFAELPRATAVDHVHAIALSSDGERLGSASFRNVKPQHGGPDAFIAGP